MPLFYTPEEREERIKELIEEKAFGVVLKEP
jgi:hypothetical protein